MNVLNAAGQVGVKWLVHASSAAVCGTPAGLSDSAPLVPLSPAGYSIFFLDPGLRRKEPGAIPVVGLAEGLKLLYDVRLNVRLQSEKYTVTDFSVLPVLLPAVGICRR